MRECGDVGLWPAAGCRASSIAGLLACLLPTARSNGRMRLPLLLVLSGILCTAAAAGQAPEWFERAEQRPEKFDVREWIAELPHPDRWPQWLEVMRELRANRTKGEPVSRRALRLLAPELLLRCLQADPAELPDALEPLLREIEQLAVALGAERGELGVRSVAEDVRALRGKIGPREATKTGLRAEDFRLRLAAPREKGRVGESLRVPDLVSELGEPAAEALLREAFSGGWRLTFDKVDAGRRTRAVGQRVALSLADRLAYAPWDLCDDFQGAPLATALARRFSPAQQRSVRGPIGVLIMAEAASGRIDAAVARWRAIEAEDKGLNAREFSGTLVDGELLADVRASLPKGALFSFWATLAREGLAGNQVWDQLRAEALASSRETELRELAERLRWERAHLPARRAAAALALATELLRQGDVTGARQVWEAALADEQSPREANNVQAAILQRWITQARVTGNTDLLRAAAERAPKIAAAFRVGEPKAAKVESTGWVDIFHQLLECGAVPGASGALSALPPGAWGAALTRLLSTARVYLALGQPEGAVAALQEMAASQMSGEPIELSFFELQHELLAARALHAAGRVAEARHALALAVCFKPKDHDGFKAALELLPATEAASILQQAAQLHPTALAPRLALARLALRAGNAGELAKLEAEAAAAPRVLRPNDYAELLRLRAEVAKARGDTVAAQASERHASVLAALSDLPFDSGAEGEAASQALEQWQKDAPGDAAVQATLALLERRLQRLPEAAAAWQRAVDLWAAPGPQSSPSIWRIRGLLESREGRAFAAPALRAALQQPNPHPRIRLLGARLALLERRADDARQLLRGLENSSLEAGVLFLQTRRAPVGFGRGIVAADPVNVFVSSFTESKGYDERDFGASPAEQWRAALRVQGVLAACGLPADGSESVLGYYPKGYRRVIDPACRAHGALLQSMEGLIQSLQRSGQEAKAKPR